MLVRQIREPPLELSSLACAAGPGNEGTGRSQGGVWLALGAGALLALGCRSIPQLSTTALVEQAAEKSEYDFGLAKEDRPQWPAEVDVNDGLTQAECIQVALHNNADFQVQLAALGMAGGHVVKAGEIPNPSYTVLLPLGRADFESTLGIPFEFLWLRDIRLAIAQQALDAEAEQLLQFAHELACDVRSAWVGLRFARRQWTLADEEAQIRQSLYDLTRQSLAVGGTTELVVEERAVDTALAQKRMLQSERDLLAAERGLWALLGIETLAKGTDLSGPDPNVPLLPTLQELKDAALVSRPDFRSAALQVEQAAEACQLSRRDWFKLSGLLDADLPDGKARISPGFKIDIPLFNQGQGDHAVAAAALDLAARRYVALRWQILVDVTEVYERFEQAVVGVSLLEETVLPAIETHIASRAELEETGLGLPEETEATRLRWIDARLTLNEERRRLALVAIQLDRVVACQCDGLRMAEPPPTGAIVTRKAD